MGEIVLAASAAYLVVGPGVSVLLWVSGLARIDQTARDSVPAFRLPVSPGLITLWPMMLLRWRTFRISGRIHLENDLWILSADPAEIYPL